MADRFNRRGGTILPDLEFANIRQAVRPQAIEEFGSLTNKLVEDFDTGLKESTDLTNRVTSLLTSPLDADRKLGERLQEDAFGSLDRIKESGDFENQVTTTRNLARDFGERAIPLIQRQQDFQGFVDQVNKSNIADKDRVISAARAKFDNDINVGTIDERGRLGRLDIEGLSGLTSADANVSEILSKAGSRVLTRLESKNAKLRNLGTDVNGRPITHIEEGVTSEIDRDQVEALLRAEIKDNPELKAFITREKELGRLLGEEDTGNFIDDLVEKQLQATLDAQTGTIKDTTTLKQLNKGSLDNGGRGRGGNKDDTLVEISKGESTQLRTTGDFGKLNDGLVSAKEEAKKYNPNDTSVNAENARIRVRNLERSKERILNVALKSNLLSDSDRGLYKEFAGMSSDQINNLNKEIVLNPYPKNLTQEERNTIDISIQQKRDRINEYLRIKDRIEDIADENLAQNSAIGEGTISLGGVSGKRSGAIYDLNQKDNKNFLTTGFSRVDKFGKYNGQDLKSTLDDQFGEGEYDASNLQGEQLVGLDNTTGTPMSSITVTLSDGTRETIKASEGEAGWAGYNERGREAINDDNIEVQKQGQSMLINSAKLLGSDSRVGQVIASANVINMKDQEDQILYRMTNDSGKTLDVHVGKRGNNYILFTKDKKSQEGGIRSKSDLSFTNGVNLTTDEGGQPKIYRNRDDLKRALASISTPQF